MRAADVAVPSARKNFGRRATDCKEEVGCIHANEVALLRAEFAALECRIQEMPDRIAAQLKEELMHSTDKRIDEKLFILLGQKTFWLLSILAAIGAGMWQILGGVHK